MGFGAEKDSIRVGRTLVFLVTVVVVRVSLASVGGRELDLALLKLGKAGVVSDLVPELVVAQDCAVVPPTEGTVNFCENPYIKKFLQSTRKLKSPIQKK